METETEHYIIWGADVGYDNVDYDDFEEEIGAETGRRFDLIYDVRGFAIAGEILLEANMFEGFELTNVQELVKDVKKFQIMTAVQKEFPDTKSSEFTTFVVSVFS